MISFEQFYLPLNEAKGKALNHMEHLEDELFNVKGADPRTGIERAFRFLNGFINMLRGEAEDAVNISTKWDGAPAIIFGTDPEDGKFFVGTKGVWNAAPVLTKKPSDIARNYPDKGDDSYQGLRDKMSLVFKWLKKLNPKNVLHGDLMFTEDSLFQTTPPGSTAVHIAFRPNTITYMIPKQSNLAKDIMKAKIGIVIHTEYNGTSLANMKEIGPEFNYDASNLPKLPQIWYSDALIRDMSGQLDMTKKETVEVEHAINSAWQSYSRLPDEVFNFLTNKDLGAPFLEAIKRQVNINLRAWAASQTGEPFERDPGKFVQGFMSEYLTNRPFSKVPARVANAQQIFNDNIEGFKSLYGLYLNLVDIKMLLHKKLITLQSLEDVHPYKDVENPETKDWELKPAQQEGIVGVQKGLDGGQIAIKLVDRSEFSVDNFLSGKPSS